MATARPKAPPSTAGLPRCWARRPATAAAKAARCISPIRRRAIWARTRSWVAAPALPRARPTQRSLPYERGLLRENAPTSSMPSNLWFRPTTGTTGPGTAEREPWRPHRRWRRALVAGDAAPAMAHGRARLLRRCRGPSRPAKHRAWPVQGRKSAAARWPPPRGGGAGGRAALRNVVLLAQRASGRSKPCWTCACYSS